MAEITAYTVPTMRRIGRGSDTEKLYRLEHDRDNAVRMAAAELARVLRSYGVIERDATQGTPYYTDVLPEALFSLLEGEDTSAALLAALAFVDWYRINRTETYETVFRHFSEHRAIMNGHMVNHECPACGLPPAEPPERPACPNCKPDCQRYLPCPCTCHEDPL